MSILEIIGAAVVVCVCIKITARVFDFCSIWFEKPQPQVYTYGGKIECIINGLDEIEEKEKEFKKKHPKIKGGMYSYNCNGGDHILSYNLVSTELIKPSDIVDYERIYTDGKINVDLKQIKKGR